MIFDRSFPRQPRCSAERNNQTGDLFTDYRVFTLLGAGELAEGSNWEAAMMAGLAATARQLLTRH
jgi:transketolase